jgi:uncharacterized membrane protein
MAHEHPRSTAKVKGHPIHVMLVPFPIAFWAATLFCDIAYWYTGTGGWAVSAAWLLGAGLVMAALAASAGFIDFLGSDRIRALSHAWQHMIGNFIAVVLAIVSLYLRLAYGVEAMAVPAGVLLSLAIIGILGFTGWLGGEMVYRHGVGVEHEHQRVPGARSHEAAAPAERKQNRRAA